jgi:hypothetical protein
MARFDPVDDGPRRHVAVLAGLKNSENIRHRTHASGIWRIIVFLFIIVFEQCQAKNMKL